MQRTTNTFVKFQTTQKKNKIWRVEVRFENRSRNVQGRCVAVGEGRRVGRQLGPRRVRHAPPRPHRSVETPSLAFCSFIGQTCSRRLFRFTHTHTHRENRHIHIRTYMHTHASHTPTRAEIREKVIPGYRRALTRCQHRAHIQTQIHTYIHSNTNVTHPRDQASSSTSSFPYGKIITRILTTPHT